MPTPEADAQSPVDRKESTFSDPPRSGTLRSPAGTTTEWHTVVVHRRILESPYSVALVLGSLDETPLPGEPGQYVWVSVKIPDNERSVLKYTLWSVQPDDTRITVKLVGGDHDCPVAREASDFIHYHVFDGNVLEVGFPPTHLSTSAGMRAIAEFAVDLPREPLTGWFRPGNAEINDKRPLIGKS